jgi:hypothetical protein
LFFISVLICFIIPFFHSLFFLLFSLFLGDDSRPLPHPYLFTIHHFNINVRRYVTSVTDTAWFEYAAQVWRVMCVQGGTPTRIYINLLSPSASPNLPQHLPIWRRFRSVSRKGMFFVPRLRKVNALLRYLPHPFIPRLPTSHGPGPHSFIPARFAEGCTPQWSTPNSFLTILVASLAQIFNISRRNPFFTDSWPG